MMALMSTEPMSRPSWNFIKHRASRPATVVRELAEISGMALARAAMAASRAGFVSCSSM